MRAKALAASALRRARRGGAAVRGHLRQDAGVVGGIDHHRDRGVVLGRGADHGRAADVDVLDAVFESAHPGDGRLEGVEVDHQQIDRLDAVRLGGAGVLGVAADGEEAAVDLGVKGLDPAVHHLGEAGEGGDVGDGDAGVPQGLGGAAGRENARRRAQ